MLETKPEVPLVSDLPVTPVLPPIPAIRIGARSASHNETAAAVIRLAELGPSDRVTIIGRGQVELLLALNRHGITRAGCEELIGPSVAAEDSDVVWLPGRVDTVTLLTALSRLSRHLRPGGSLVVGPATDAPDRDSSWIRRLLFERGFTSIVQMQVGSEPNVLLSARRGCRSRLQIKAA